MDSATKLTLSELRIQFGSTQSQIVQSWHGTDTLLNLLNSDTLTVRGTALMREQVIEARKKISEGLNLLTPVQELLEMVVPFKLPEDDADGVE